MKNMIQAGENITLPAPYDVASGAFFAVGALAGVAQAAAATGEDVVMVRRGVYELAKTEAQAWTQGVKLYWDATNKLVTSTATGNTLIGAAFAAAANPSTTGTVLLDGAVR